VFNSGATMMVNFLFEAGLPYLALRSAIRSNNSTVINDIYIFMINRFRASNKYLYSKLCVMSLHTCYIMKPEIRAIWDKMRTASLRGHVGRNVGWDFTLERMNLEVSMMLGSNISGARIQEVIRQLNGVRHIRSTALSAFGIGDDGDLSEYNGILESDVQQLVRYLKDSFHFDGQNDALKLFIPRGNPFRSDGAVAPWTRLSDCEAHESTREYVTRTMRNAPRNNLL
jgi:hypothetical protein